MGFISYTKPTDKSNSVFYEKFFLKRNLDTQYIQTDTKIINKDFIHETTRKLVQMRLCDKQLP